MLKVGNIWLSKIKSIKKWDLKIICILEIKKFIEPEKIPNITIIYSLYVTVYKRIIYKYNSIYHSLKTT